MNEYYYTTQPGTSVYDMDGKLVYIVNTIKKLKLKWKNEELPRIVFVYGAPGSGKTNWIKENVTDDWLLCAPTCKFLLYCF